MITRESGSAHVTGWEMVVEIEAGDVGKVYRLKVLHIPYGMGSGYVRGVSVEEEGKAAQKAVS